MNLSHLIRTGKNVVTANSPALLVGTAIVGVVTTGVLAAKGGYKARGIVDAERAKRCANLDSDTADTIQEYNEIIAAGGDLTSQEKIQLTWLCYAVPAVTGASTIASVVGVHSIHTKRHAALAGLYAVANNKLDDYREKAEELLGPKKSQTLNDAVAQKAIDRNPPVDHEVVITGADNTQLCYDDWSGRYFMGSVPVIEQALAKINLQLVEDGEANLNDFYDHVGLTPVTMGSGYGWSGGKISGVFGSTTAPDGRSAVSISFRTAPKEL